MTGRLMGRRLDPTLALCPQCLHLPTDGHTVDCPRNPRGHFITRVTEPPHECHPPKPYEAQFHVGSVWQCACSDIWEYRTFDRGVQAWVRAEE